MASFMASLAAPVLRVRDGAWINPLRPVHSENPYGMWTYPRFAQSGLKALTLAVIIRA